MRRKLSKFRQNVLKAIRLKNVMGGIQFPELPSERESATLPTGESIDNKLAEGEEEWQQLHVILFTPLVRVCTSLRTINNSKDQLVFC